VFLNRSSECGEITSVTKHVVLDCFEDLFQGRVELEVAVEVTVAEIFDVLSEIAEEENVLIADLASNLDLYKKFELVNSQSIAEGRGGEYSRLRHHMFQ
jgi:hypothetical protein